MEIFSYKTNKAYKTRVEKVNHVDESVHLGHYHKFYIDDEKREYVSKVLVTSGVAYTMNSALHSILDGYLWEWFGLPIITVVIPAFSYGVRYLFFILNPRNFVRRRRFGRISWPGRRKPHQPPKPPHAPAKPSRPHDQPSQTPQSPFKDYNYGLISESQLQNKSLFERVDRKGIIQSVKWGLLAWLVLGILSPRSLLGMRNSSPKFSSVKVPTSRAGQGDETFSSTALRNAAAVRGGARSSGNGNGQDPSSTSLSLIALDTFNEDSAFTALLARLKSLAAGLTRLLTGA